MTDAPHSLMQQEASAPGQFARVQQRGSVWIWLIVLVAVGGAAYFAYGRWLAPTPAQTAAAPPAGKKGAVGLKGGGGPIPVVTATIPQT